MSFETNAKNKARLGVYNYNNAGADIAYTNTGFYEDITNDAAGAYTNKSGALDDIADVYDASSNSFDWSGLSVGDTADIRLDVEVTTTQANQEITIDLELGIGGFSYKIPFVGYSKINGSGNYKINVLNSVYMGDENTLNNDAKFKFKSDANATIKVNGWYCRIIKKYIA